MDASATSISSPPPAAANESGADVPVFDIRPSRGWVPINFKEIFHFRELLFFLIWRDVKVRYKQTVLGFSWAILQPLVTMLIMGTIFGIVAGFNDKLPPELKARNIPYNIFLYAGLLPWMFFNTGVGMGGQSLVNQQNLLTKIYFPRLFVPASVVGAAMVDTVISFGVFLVLMALAHIAPPWTIVFIPLLLILTIALTLGLAFLLASLTVTYRDFRFLIPFMLNFWQFVSPVYFPQNPKALWKQRLLELNPLYGIINAFRSALIGEHWDFAALAVSIVEVAVILAIGVYYFKKTERRFADIA